MSGALLPRRTELPTLFHRPNVFRVRYRWPLVVLVIGASIDFFTTLYNIRAYGSETETHLVQRWFMEWFGLDWGFVLGKAIQVAFALLVAAWWQPWCAILLTLCGVLYTLAGISNYFLLF